MPLSGLKQIEWINDLIAQNRVVIAKGGVTLEKPYL